MAHPDPRTLLLVTGHTRGLGAALVAEGLRRSMQVGCIGRGPAPAGTRAVRADLADAERAAHAVAEALDAVDLSGVDCVHLVANAGVLDPIRRAGDLGAAAVAHAVAVNLTAPIAMTDALLRATDAVAVERRITLVSSGAAHTPYAGWSVYCSTKAGLDHFARTVSLEAPPRTRIASVAPGVVDTDMQARIRASDPADFPQRPRFDAMFASGALASPADVAVRLLAHATSEAFGAEPVVDLRHA